MNAEKSEHADQQKIHEQRDGPKRRIFTRIPGVGMRLQEEGRLDAEMTVAAPELWVKNLGRLVGAVIIVTGFVLLVLTLVTFFKG